MDILNYFPGQQATIFLEVTDGYSRANSLTIPIVNRIILPSLNLATGYPQSMNQFDTGLYYFQFILPNGGISIGTYLVDVIYTDPTTGLIKNKAYQILCNAPYGNFTVVTTG